MRNHMPVVPILLVLTAYTASCASEEAKPPLQAGQAMSASMPMDMGSDAIEIGHTPATPDQVAFENLKKLAGRWEAPMANHKTIVDTFQPFAFGTAILGEEWVDGKQITSTVFYLVGSQLRADHYCDYLNQPRYVARTSTDPSVIDFEFLEATNLDAHPQHFHATTWHFIDANHLTQDWHVEGGPKGKGTVRLEFVRKDEGTPKTASRGNHGCDSASFHSGSEAQSVTGTDLRRFWRAARHLGYLAINVLAEDFGVRWCVEDRPVRGQSRHGGEGSKRMAFIRMPGQGFGNSRPGDVAQFGELVKAVRTGIEVVVLEKFSRARANR
jgi:hypothetical protein